MSFKLLSLLEAEAQAQLETAVRRIAVSNPTLYIVLTNLPSDVGIQNVWSPYCGTVRVTFILGSSATFNVLFSPDQGTWHFGDVTGELTENFWHNPDFRARLLAYLVESDQITIHQESRTSRR